MGAKTDLLLLAALLWQQLAPAAAQISGCTASVVTRSCVAGDTPIKYIMTCTNYPAGLVSGSTITWTFNKAIFQAFQSPSGDACKMIDNTAGSHGATVSCTTSGDGLSVAIAHTGGANANGPSLTFEIGGGSGNGGGTGGTGGYGLQVLPSASAWPGAVPADNIAIASVAHSGGATFTGSVVFFQTITPPVVTLNSGSMVVADQPGQLAIKVVFPVASTFVYFAAKKATDNSVPVAVFAQDSDPAVHLGLTVVPTSGSAPAVRFLSTDIASHRVNIEFSSQIAKGTALEFRMTTPLLGALPNTLGAVVFNIWGDTQVASDGAEFAYARDGFGTITASVSGDPVTWIGDRRVEFKIPEGKLTTMLAMPDLVVSASPFWGISGEQWIGRIVVTSAKTQAMVVQVDVEKDLTNFTRSVLAPNDFDSMTVLTPPDMVRGQPPHDSQLTHPEGFVMLMGKMPCKYEQHVPCREGLLIFSQFATLFIASSSASEYYGEHTAEALRHGHLDFDVFDMKETGAWQGVLPELWGFLPMSAETEAMLTPEELQLLAGNAAAGNSSTGVASVKSVEPKGICIGCSDSAAQDRWSLMGGGHTAEL
eukprot:TRINITY_DN45234_c0_g1_i1.p1 TRINITY_DN45234_c0_g1~~TRINITY_DN45234_c0_g1_i1.p1  ORF type:complete len:602 (-),score=97.72 TRINITY_DN45234_c0_g1_i1:42-1820(-)